MWLYEPTFLQPVAKHFSPIAEIDPGRQSAAKSRLQLDTAAPNMDVWGAASLVCRGRSVLAEILGKIDPGIPDGQEGLDRAPSA